MGPLTPLQAEQIDVTPRERHVESGPPHCRTPRGRGRVPSSAAGSPWSWAVQQHLTGDTCHRSPMPLGPRRRRGQSNAAELHTCAGSGPRSLDSVGRPPPDGRAGPARRPRFQPQPHAWGRGGRGSILGQVVATAGFAGFSEWGLRVRTEGSRKSRSLELCLGCVSGEAPRGRVSGGLGEGPWGAEHRPSQSSGGDGSAGPPVHR